MLTWVIGVALLTNTDSDQGLSKVRDAIVSGGYKRVAVCPRPIFRKGEVESFVAEIGPQGVVWCENLYKFLQLNAKDDGFSLITSRSVSQKMVGMSLEDLGDRARLRQLSDGLGAEVLVILEITVKPATDKEPASWNGQPKLVNLVENTETAAKAEKATLSLSDWAFMGNSFEARRWNGERLELVGFREGTRIEEGYAMGLEAEQMQYNALFKEQPHPLRSSASVLPYGLQIVVADQPLPLKEIGGKMYVEINPGQNFEFRLNNDDTHSVMCALYVDGVNSIGQKFEHPLVTSPTSRWLLDPGSTGKVKGWFIRGANGDHANMPFRIVPKAESVAAGIGQTVDGNFGMITAIFYTNGVQGIDPAPSLLASTGRGGSQFGVGADQAAAINLNFGAAKAGLMLAAVTVHYRTADELKELEENQKSNGGGTGASGTSSGAKSNGTEPPVPDGGGKTKPVVKPVSGGNSKTPKVPGEDESFPDAADAKSDATP